MSDKKPGTPLAAAHLRPEMQQQASALRDVEEQDWPQPGRIMTLPDDGDTEWLASLRKLREPFPDDMIEKLPKPMWKGAWDSLKGSNCSTCGGYHVVANCIHLGYVGHANATNRLLDADLTWNWEPMSYTEAGTPFFSDGGLWIKLTVCGVTRLGFGDGKNPKEIIGDAIRNAAMRFGVALDLWSKIDLHAERNPGDGQTQQPRNQPGRGARDGARGQGSEAVAADTAPAENQDALDTLASVCDEHGYARGAMGRMYAEWLAKTPDGTTYAIVDADPEHILAFAEHLVEQATADPRESADGQRSLDDEDDGGAGIPEGDTGTAEPISSGPAGDGSAAPTGDGAAAEDPPMTAEGAF